MNLGLATKPEVLLARQERFRADYELTEAKGAVQRAHADLAANIGVSPAEPLHVIDLSQEPLPQALPATVDQVMDDALVGRPDLAGRLAVLRAREAEVRRARASYWPTLGFAGDVGGLWRDFRGGPPFHSHEFAEPLYGTFLNFEWTLFDALERENTVREAESQRAAAEAELESVRLGVLRDVFKSYADAKTAAGQVRVRDRAAGCLDRELRRHARDLSQWPGRLRRAARGRARAGARAVHEHLEQGGSPHGIGGVGVLVGCGPGGDASPDGPRALSGAAPFLDLKAPGSIVESGRGGWRRARVVAAPAQSTTRRRTRTTWHSTPRTWPPWRQNMPTGTRR